MEELLDQLTSSATSPESTTETQLPVAQQALLPKEEDISPKSMILNKADASKEAQA